MTHELVRPAAVEARDGYRIWLRYTDGASGEVDLSDLARRGVFAAWDDRDFFEAVEITPHRTIPWPGELDLCGDMLYMRMTGKAVEELFTDLRTDYVNA